MSATISLAGKVAVVTGGGRGSGRRLRSIWLKRERMW